MPTGYTAELTDTMPFSEFAIRCARAFGALALMRDDPMDAPIPVFEPSDYHRQALEDAKFALAVANELTEAEAVRAIATHNEEAARHRKRLRNEATATSGKYRRMINFVEAWKPPTPDHEGLKTFMREQLTESLKFDCHDEEFILRCYPDFIGSAAEWIAAQKTQAAKDMLYHQEHWRQEQERTNGRNEWVRQLRESLNQECDHGG